MFSSTNLQEILFREDKELRSKRCGMTLATLRSLFWRSFEPNPRTIWPHPSVLSAVTANALEYQLTWVNACRVLLMGRNSTKITPKEASPVHYLHQNCSPKFGCKDGRTSHHVVQVWKCPKEATTNCTRFMKMQTHTALSRFTNY